MHPEMQWSQQHTEIICRPWSQDTPISNFEVMMDLSKQANLLESKEPLK